jgi:hypothetical protein
MKTKKFNTHNRQLRLNKKTIADLNNLQMKYIFGGGETDSICIDTCTEPDTEGTCHLEVSDMCYSEYCQGTLGCGGINTGANC